MKKIKLIAMMMILCMVVGIMAGCGSSKSTSADGSAAESGTDAGLQKIKDAGVLKVGCKVDVLNYGMQNTATGEYEGVEIDLAYEIAADIFGCTADEAKAQKKVEFQGVTAKTRGPLLDNGDIDLVIATFTITEERKSQYNFSTAYVEDALGLMCKKASGFSSMKDINGSIIGVAQGSTTKDAISKYIQEQNLGVDVEFQEFDGYPALNAALSSGNIDIFAVDRSILGGYMDDTTMILPERFATQSYGVASKLANKELASEVDKVVSSLIDSGKMKTMLGNWNIQ